MRNRVLPDLQRRRRKCTSQFSINCLMNYFHDTVVINLFHVVLYHYKSVLEKAFEIVHRKSPETFCLEKRAKKICIQLLPAASAERIAGLLLSPRDFCFSPSATRFTQHWAGCKHSEFGGLVSVSLRHEDSQFEIICRHLFCPSKRINPPSVNTVKTKTTHSVNAHLVIRKSPGL